MLNNTTLTALANCCSAAIAELKKDFEINNQAGDAIWILTSAFIIFTMQSGFGLLEAGSVSSKNECNIMIKNAVDVIFGAFGYWLCGFGLSFGDDEEYANGFSGIGYFLTDSTQSNFGTLYAKYFFQLSFATTATTIVSGAMAERTNLKAYMFFSFVNFTSYVFPAHWIWDDNGFLRKLGVVDVAGCGPVHLVGGVSAVVATVLLKPRHGYFDKMWGVEHTMASPTNIVLGTFMLWWGWLGFNCGSTFGVSGGKWQMASRAAVTTVNGSVGSGLWAVIYCYVLTKDYKGRLDVPCFTSCILGGLVSITAVCAICKPWEAIIIGLVGGIITCYGSKLVYILKIDDPVQCISVHGFCSIWGMISVGLFAENTSHEGFVSTNGGIFKGGSWSFFGYQLLAILCITVWSAITTFLQLFATDRLFGLRMSIEEELKGADDTEHGIKTETHIRGTVRPSTNEAFEPTFMNWRTALKQRKKSNASKRNGKVNQQNGESSKQSPQLKHSRHSQQQQQEQSQQQTPQNEQSRYYKQGILNYGFVTINNGETSLTDECHADIRRTGTSDDDNRGAQIIEVTTFSPSKRESRDEVSTISYLRRSSSLPNITQILDCQKSN